VGRVLDVGPFELAAAAAEIVLAKVKEFWVDRYEPAALFAYTSNQIHEECEERTSGWLGEFRLFGSQGGEPHHFIISRSPLPTAR